MRLRNETLRAATSQSLASLGLVGIAALAGGPVAAQRADSLNTVNGVVVDERGAPTADVEVVLRPYPSEYQVDLFLLGYEDTLPPAVDSTPTGPDGGYSLSAAEAGPYLLEFRPPAVEGRQRSTSPLIYGNLVPLKGSRTAQTVEMPNRHPVAVRILDAAGDPIEGALVVADPSVWIAPRYLGALTRLFRDVQTGTFSPPPEELILPTFHRSVSRTDSEGIARFRMPTAEASLVVSAPGFVRAEGKSASGRAAFRLERAPGVRLRVRGPDGALAPGVLIRTPDTTEAARNLTGANLLGDLGTPGALGAPGAPLAVTGAEGEAVVAPNSTSETSWELEGPDRAFARVSLPTPSPEEGSTRERVVEVRLEAPSRIPGRVVDVASGLAVEGAAIWVQRLPGHRATSGPSGAFDLETGPATTGTRLLATAGGYLPEQTDIAASTDPNPAETRIGLTPEAPIRGVVTDSSGRGVGGAKIRAQPRGAGVPPVGSLTARPATSAPDGAFQLDEVVYGHVYRLTAQAAGYANTSLDLPPLEPGVTIDPIHMVLSAGRQVLGAAVDSNGNPVADVDVALLWPLDPSDFRSPFDAPAVATTTNERGAFAFPAVAPGDYELRLRHPGYSDRPPAPIDVPSGESDLDLGDLTLVAGGTIRGIVTDPDGEPVPGASLQARGRNRIGGTVRTATTDADGRFQMTGLSTDLADLGIRASGYPLLVRPGIRVDSGDSVLIELVPGSAVSGRVVDAGGNDAVGVPVRLRIERDRRSGGSPLLMGPRDMFPRRVTDSQGRFRFDELIPGTWSAEARKGEETAKAGPIELAAAGEREIELVLGTPNRLTVVVATATGDPVAGARITLESPGERLPTGYGQTDGSGEARIDISPGSATVKVEHERLRDESRQVELATGANELRIELHPAAELAGTVRSHDGVPLALATVEAVTEYSPNTERHQRNTASDRNGAFRVTDVEPGSYIVTARSSGYADGGPETPIRVDRESIEGIEIVLQPEARIVGVVSGLTPSGLAQVEVRAWKDSRSRETTPDTEGNFSLEGLSPGAWRVVATRGTPGSERRIAENVTIDQGAAETFVELRFERGRRLSGQVLEAGEPLAGARLGIGGQSIRTDREGRFAVEGLEPGRTQVRISRPDFSGTQYRAIDLQTDLEGVRLELAPAAATVAGTVVDAASGQPLDFVSLIAADAATINALATDQDAGASLVGASFSFSQPGGRFTLELGPNADHLLAAQDGYESLRIPLAIEPGERREGLVIELQPEESGDPNP